MTRHLLAFLVLMMLLPQSAGLTLSEDAGEITLEVPGASSINLEISHDDTAVVNISINGSFHHISAHGDSITVWLTDGDDEKVEISDIQFIIDGNTTIEVVFDSSGWKARRNLEADPAREFSVSVIDTATNEAETVVITVKADNDWDTDSSPLRFFFAMLPLISIFVGIAVFKQDGMTMSLVGWAIAGILAMTIFSTGADVVWGATIVGILKAFGISIAVLFTMLMILIMKEVGALDVISDVIKRVVSTKEEQALFIGIAFGSFLTSLGITTPAMFPALLMAMGFTPFAAVMISVLGYNATTSYALLGIPITLPAEIGGIDAAELSWRISLYLPVISVMLSIAMLWFIGGKKSVKKGIVPAVLVGLAIAASCLLFTWTNIHPINIGGVEVYVPVRIIGVLAGAVAMLVVWAYHRIKHGKIVHKTKIDKRKVMIAFFPWVLLSILAAVTSVASIQLELETMLGSAEIIHVYDQAVDLNILSQIYTWILVATIVSLPVLRPSKKQLRTATDLWLRRGWKPFTAFSMYFSIAYIMFFSGLELVNGGLVPRHNYADVNMNLILGTGLAAAFGSGFMFVAGSLGVFGSFVGGSETASNVMFLQVQRTATAQTNTDFMTAYGAHAAGGGIASAITPSKINNSVVLIGEGGDLESKVMRSNTVFVVIATIAIGLMTALFITLGW